MPAGRKDGKANGAAGGNRHDAPKAVVATAVAAEEPAGPASSLVALGMARRRLRKALKAAGDNPDDPAVAQANARYQAIKKAYEEKEGSRIRHACLPERFDIFVAYHESGDLQFRRGASPFPDRAHAAALEKSIYDLDRLASDIRGFAKRAKGTGRARGPPPAATPWKPAIVLEGNPDLPSRVGALATMVLTAYDDWLASSRDKAAEEGLATQQQTYRAELRRLEAEFRRVWEAPAKSDYLVGAVFGTLLTALFCWILAVRQGDGRVEEAIDASDIATIIFVGALAGAVSILTRIRSSSFGLRWDDRPWATRTYGIVRPVLAGFLGFGLFVLVSGRIVPLEVPSPQTNFYAALAFLAGFTERFAPDIIAGAGQRVKGGAAPAEEKEKPEPATPAG